MKTAQSPGGLALVGIVAALTLISEPARAADIDRVEPPMWWQGFLETQLQLMVHGRDIANLTPSLDYAGVSISRVARTENPNYLFIYLDIDADADPGDIEIRFSNGSDSLTHRYPLLQKSADPDHARGFSSRDSIYLITPDRFANGNPGNDDVAGYADAADRSEPGGRHGGDIAGIRQHLDYIHDLGFTAIWLNPVLENAMDAYSYHGYATTDFYTVDPRFGSNEEYRQLVDDAREMGLGVIMDMIVNHGGSEALVDGGSALGDWLNFAEEYVETSHMRTTWQDPYAATSTGRGSPTAGSTAPCRISISATPCWQTTSSRTRCGGSSTWASPASAWTPIPTLTRTYMSEWTRRVMPEYPDFNVVGEEWSHNPAIVSYWQRRQGQSRRLRVLLAQLMDFPLSERLARACTRTKP